MKKYKLYNLFIGDNPIIRNFEIGPYNLEICDNYDDLQKDFVMSPNTDFAIHTADISIEKEPRAYLPSTWTQAHPPAIWDIVQILSFLSGHSIFTENLKGRFHSIKYNSSVVGEQFIPEALIKAWNNRKKFVNEREMRPFWLYLNMNRTNEAQIVLLIGCICLEIIQEIEWNNINNPAKDSKDSEINILSILINKIHELIDDSHIDNNLKNKFKGISGKWATTSSVNKLKNLLIKYGIIDDSLYDIQQKRIKYINQLRNSMVHSGDLVLPNWLKGKKEKLNTTLLISTQLIPSIIELYILKKFGLENFLLPTANKFKIQNYIYNGKWE